VRVTGPNGFSSVPQLLGVDVNSNGTPRTASYRLTPPGGAWDPADNGTYAVDLESNQVADTSGNFVPAVRLGQFSTVLMARVTGVRVNDGSPQRSRVTSLTVTFNGTLQFLGTTVADTFRLRRADGLSIGLVATVDNTGGQTSVTLIFTGAGLEAGSLADGNYTLSVFGATARVGPNGPILDADGDDIPGGDFAFQIHRLLGDVNGDKTVNGVDLAMFRGAFGTTTGGPGYLDYLDLNGDGAINGLDLAQYRTRFGTTLP